MPLIRRNLQLDNVERKETNREETKQFRSVFVFRDCNSFTQNIFDVFVPLFVTDLAVSFF